MKIKKSSIKNVLKIILYSIVFFALIKPDSLEYLGFTWLSNTLIVLDIILMMLLTLMLIANKFKMSKMTLIIIIYFIIGMIPTIVHSNNLFSFIKVAGPGIAICLLTDFLIQKKEKIYFESIYYTLGIAYFLNFITIIKYYRVGMYQMDKVSGDLYLMGYDNGMIYNLLPLCGVSLILSYIKTGKLVSKTSMFAIILTVISEFFVGSASGIVEIVLFLFLAISINNSFVKKIMKPFIMFVNYFFMSIGINILRIQNIFEYLIVDVLKKDLTFTNRTILWDYAIKSIKQNPIIGIGYGENNIIGIYYRNYSHPHSMFLDILVKGGIILLAVFAYILIHFANIYKKSKNRIVKNIILAVITIFLIGEIVNSVQYKVFFWSFLVLIEYTNIITHKGDNDGKK